MDRLVGSEMSGTSAAAFGPPALALRPSGPRAGRPPRPRAKAALTAERRKTSCRRGESQVDAATLSRSEPDSALGGAPHRSLSTGSDAP